MMLSLSLTWLPMKMSATIGDDGDECKDKSVFGETLAVDLTDPVDDGDQARVHGHR